MNKINISPIGKIVNGNEVKIVWLQLLSDYQKEFKDAAMEQKLMFEMLHLVEFLRNVATLKKDISDREKW